MAINSRRKGNKAERIAAKVIQKWTGKTFSKTPASGGLHWRKSNVAGDIVCTKEGHYFPFVVEVKSHAKIDFSHLLHPTVKNVDILTFWDQVKKDADRVNKEPMLLIRYNGLPKNFYFLVIHKSTAEILHKKHLRGIKLKTLEYYDYKTNIALVIYKSNEFFTMPYKEVRKTIKTWVKNK